MALKWAALAAIVSVGRGAVPLSVSIDPAMPDLESTTASEQPIDVDVLSPVDGAYYLLGGGRRKV